MKEKEELMKTNTIYTAMTDNLGSKFKGSLNICF